MLESSHAVGEIDYRESLFAWASPLGKHSVPWDIRVRLGDAAAIAELVSAARWKIPAWSEMPFALASPLPEREAKCGEGAGRRPLRRE